MTTTTTYNVKNAAGRTLLPANLPNLEMAERGAKRAHKATGEIHTVEMSTEAGTATVYIAG